MPGKEKEALHSNDPSTQCKLKSWPPFRILLFELMCTFAMISNSIGYRVIPERVFNIGVRATFGFHRFEIDIKIYSGRFVIKNDNPFNSLNRARVLFEMAKELLQ